jgi:hypothetical protein
MRRAHGRLRNSAQQCLGDACQKHWSLICFIRQNSVTADACRSSSAPIESTCCTPPIIPSLSHQHGASQWRRQHKIKFDDFRVQISGVRNSWLMLATNWLLCWLAISRSSTVLANSRVRTCTSSKRRAFSIAMTAWSAKVCSRSICLSHRERGRGGTRCHGVAGAEQEAFSENRSSQDSTDWPRR